MNVVGYSLFDTHCLDGSAMTFKKVRHIGACVVLVLLDEIFRHVDVVDVNFFPHSIEQSTGELVPRSGLSSPDIKNAANIIE